MHYACSHNVRTVNFVDRQQEMERLQTLAARSGGGFGVVYGRRRVGKTRLMLEWNKRHDGIYTVADQSAPDVQRRYFVDAVAGRFPALAAASYPDWRALLQALAAEAKSHKWRGPLILDELPYLVGPSPELPSVLQQWIDHAAAEAKLTVVVAGSSQRMMQGLVMDASEPLYGRALEILKLNPIPLGHLGKAVGIRDAAEAVRWYAAWGGIPRYWVLAEPYTGDLDRAVDRSVLDPMGVLHTEPERLLLDEIPPAPALRPILDVIGMGAHRLTEIAGRIGQKATSLSRPLSRLIDMEFVKREVPFGETEKSSKRALYKLADPLMRLWFRVVAPNRAFLAQAPPAARIKLWRSAVPALRAQAWEDLCRQSVPLLTAPDSRLAGYGPWLPASRFWQPGEPEWDIVSQSLDGKHLLLGEAKWTEKPATETFLRRTSETLIRKGTPNVKTADACNIIRCIFVNAAPPSVRELNGTHIITAHQVVNSLR